MTSKSQNKGTLALQGIFTLAALIIVLDFALPGLVFTHQILDVQRERQQYHNAAANHHYTYRVNTGAHEFSVSDDFANLQWQGAKIEYAISWIFEETNWYQLDSSTNRSYPTIRILSGLVVPLLLLIAIFVSYRFKKKLGLLIFVLQVLLIGDLIFLWM